MLFGYALRLHRNTEPGFKHGSENRSGVLGDVGYVGRSCPLSMELTPCWHSRLFFATYFTSSS